MERKKLFLFVICSISIILFSNFINAEVQTYPTMKRNECGQFTQLFFNSTFQNVSYILKPDKTLIQIDTSMDKRVGGFYNITFCQTDQDGEYIINGYGDKNGVTESWNYNFFVTKTGVILTNSEAYFYIFFIVVFFILIIFMIYLSTVIPWSNETDQRGTITRITKKKYLKLFCMEFATGLILLMFNLLAGLFNSFTSFNYLSSLIDNIYLIVLICSYVITFTIFGIFFIAIYWDLFMYKELMKWGQYVSEKY